MLFGLFAVIESPAVFDVVVHGRKDLNRLCTSRQCIYRTLLSSLHRTVLSNSLSCHSKTYYLLMGIFYLYNLPYFLILNRYLYRKYSFRTQKMWKQEAKTRTANNAVLILSYKLIFYGSSRIFPILGFDITNIIKIFNKCKFKGWYLE